MQPFQLRLLIPTAPSLNPRPRAAADTTADCKLSLSRRTAHRPRSKTGMEQEVICIDSDEPVAPTRRKKQKQEPRKQRTPAQRNATAAALRRAQVDQVDLCSTEELDDEDYGPGPSPKPKQRRRKAAAADLDESPRCVLCMARSRTCLSTGSPVWCAAFDAPTVQPNRRSRRSHAKPKSPRRRGPMSMGSQCAIQPHPARQPTTACSAPCQVC